MSTSLHYYGVPAASRMDSATTAEGLADAMSATLDELRSAIEADWDEERARGSTTVYSGYGTAYENLLEQLIDLREEIDAEE